jgi:hypothetical protein
VRTTRILVAVGAVLLAVHPASAQLVVNDPTTTARNAVTAVLKSQLLQTLRLERDRLRQMSRRLSRYTSLDKYRLDDPPRWRTHGGDFLFGQPYNDALIFGDATGAAYLSLSRGMADAGRLLDRLGPDARRAVIAQLAATIDAAAASAIAGTHQTGQLRFSGRRQELLAIDALETHVVDPSEEQSMTAVLDKISGAAFIGARQKQARLQLLTAIAEQLVIENKRARDAQTASMNMLVGRLRDGRNASASLVAGSAADLRSWRQP